MYTDIPINTINYYDDGLSLKFYDRHEMNLSNISLFDVYPFDIENSGFSDPHIGSPTQEILNSIKLILLDTHSDQSATALHSLIKSLRTYIDPMLNIHILNKYSSL